MAQSEQPQGVPRGDWRWFERSVYLGCTGRLVLDAAVGCVDRRIVVGWWTLVGRCTYFSILLFLCKITDSELCFFLVLPVYRAT